MIEELEKRIKHLEVILSAPWVTFEERIRAAKRLKRLEQLLDDMQGF